MRIKVTHLVVVLLFLSNETHKSSAGEPGQPIRVSVGCWTPESVTQDLLLSKITQRIPLEMRGPNTVGNGSNCAVHCYDMDNDGDIDLRDFGAFSNWMSLDDPAAIVQSE